MPLKIGTKEFTKQQAIFLGVIGGIILLIILVIVGILPGRRGGGEPRVDLVVWGVGDEEEVWNATIKSFGRSYSNTKVEYVAVDPENYEADLLNALAAGRGPDVFMFHNTWLPKHADKTVPAPPDKITPVTVSGLFPQVVEADFITDGRVYALPLSVDTLAMAYNRDLFDKKQLVFPPKTWTEFGQAALKLRTVEDGTIAEPAAAIGGTSESVVNATDLLSVILMQHGAPIVEHGARSADFGSDGEEALELYTQFADPGSAFYTWDDSLGPSHEAFANEEVAITFVYAEDMREIRAANPFLDYEIRPIPQLDITSPVNIANYWGLAVSTQTVSADAAWNFVIFAATDQRSAQTYIGETGRPPALRFLVNTYLNNPDIGAFTGQALTAKSWQRPDSNAVERIFDDMIKVALTGEVTTARALSQARSELSSLLRR